MNIYVLPSEPGIPPRALIGEFEVAQEQIAGEGCIATWSADMGCWTVSGLPLPAALGEVITEHAKSLGVEW